MSLVCSLTGRVPWDPVVTSSGYLFDKTPLLQELANNGGHCPLTKQKLDVETGLQPVKRRPDQGQPLLRTIPAANIPGTVNMVQQAFEDLTHQTFVQGADLDKCREQLIYLLQQNDAGSRTIKRLLGERDMARKTVSELEAQMAAQRKTLVVEGSLSLAGGAGAPAAAAARQPTLLTATGFTEHWKKKVADHDDHFKKARKEGLYKQKHATLTPFTTNRAMKIQNTYPGRHQSSAPGILCCDLSIAETMATGGVDGNIEIFNVASPDSYAKAVGHDAAVTGVAFLSASMLVSSSKDKTVKVWADDGRRDCSSKIVGYVS